MAHPRRRALATAGIVIFFDVTLALACFFGVGVVMETFPVVRMAVLLAGSLVVLAIGVGLLRTKEAGRRGGPSLPQGPKRCPPPLWSPGAIHRRSLTAP